MKAQCRLKRHDRSSAELVVRSLSKFPSSVLADALGRERGLVPVGLRAIPSGFAGTMVGNALTVSVLTGDNLMLQRAIGSAQPGDIIVCDCGDQTERAVAGEPIFRYAASRGVRDSLSTGRSETSTSCELSSSRCTPEKEPARPHQDRFRNHRNANYRWRCRNSLG